MDILTIRGLEKSFGEKKVLRGVELSVPAGSVFGFVGKNGAGKTTTMKAILGLLKPDGGEITVAGEPVCFGQTPTNRHVGYLPDVPAFYPFMTAKEYLRLCGESMGMRHAEIEERTRELLALVGLDAEKHRIKGYSRGMKQRLGIASALLARPKLLICDEPTSALDPIGRKEILDILSSVREQTTVLFSTHILSDVERICTRVALLDDGVIAMQGSVGELKSHCHAGGFTVAVVNVEDAARIEASFVNATRTDANTLSLTGGDEEQFALLAFLSQNHIPIMSVSRMEPSLEALFVEVVSK